MLVGLALAAGCDAKPSEHETAAVTDSGMPMPMVAPTPPAGVPDSSAAPAEGAPLTLSPVGNTGMSGTARLARRDSTLEITLTASGKPSATLQAHVHKGRCGRDEGMAVPLTPITTAADGSGTSTTTVPTRDLTGDLFVQVHGDGDAPILCSDIPSGS
jgi:hypothetical protein